MEGEAQDRGEGHDDQRQPAQRAGRPLKRLPLSHSIAQPATNSAAARTAIGGGGLQAKAPNTIRPRPARAMPADHQGSAALSRLKQPEVPGGARAQEQHGDIDPETAS